MWMRSSSARRYRLCRTATWVTPLTAPTPPTSALRLVWGADTDAPPRWPRSSSAARLGQYAPGLSPQQPFGGFKWSGIGVENGPWGLAEFSEFQVVHRSKAADGLNVNTAMLLS